MNPSFSDLKFINQIGQTLNVDERMRLQLAILKIREHYQFDEVLFWGRVEGVEKDYYIAMGLNFKNQYEFPQLRFFWTSNNFSFAELPPYNQDFSHQAANLRKPFTGQHEHIVFRVDEAGDFEDSLEIPAQLPAKHFSELERLSFVVHSVQNECAAVPVGSYRLTPTHELVRAPNFKGVAPELENYMHFRPPRSQAKRDLIARDEALFRSDFLDSLTTDKPADQWSIQQDSTKRNTTVRSLLWPGFVAFSNEFTFGYGYFGEGVKNADFEFLL